jgi:hypothetical protein
VTLVGPAALCRLDDALVGRIRRGDDLTGLVLSSVAAICLGAGAYGVAFGIWRGGAQAVFSAVKLPALFLAIASCTMGLGAMVAVLLRSRLSFRQTAVCMLVSLAVTSTVLFAASPIAILFALAFPPPDPTVVGLAIGDPRVAPSLVVARGLLVLHVVIIASAGMAGVVRLRGLLGRLGLANAVARRVLVSWMAAQFLCGAELSWLMRPFFGRPHLPPSFSCDDLLEGNFFEELAVSLRSAFGPMAPLVLVVVGLAMASALAHSLRSELDRVDVAIGPSGLLVNGGPRVVSWAAVLALRTVDGDVHIELVPDETLAQDALTVGCASEEDATRLANEIEAERARVHGGPFRTRG